MHFLVDVGASTLDVCSFNIMTQDGADKFPIFTADVKELGTTHLHRRRISGAVAGARAHADDAHDTRDPLCPISSNLEDYVAPAGEPQIRCRGRTARFRQRLSDNNSADDRRCANEYRDPNSPFWSKDIPLFFCGGAKQVACYREAVEPLSDWICGYVHSCQGVSIAELPSRSHWRRILPRTLITALAVAWGLSQDSLNIGEYVRPSAIEDICTGPTPRYRSCLCREGSGLAPFPINRVYASGPRFLDAFVRFDPGHRVRRSATVRSTVFYTLAPGHEKARIERVESQINGQREATIGSDFAVFLSSRSKENENLIEANLGSYCICRFPGP